jgi:hypothetical protein
MAHGSAGEYWSEASEEMEVLADDILLMVKKIQTFAKNCKDFGSLASTSVEADTELRQMATVVLALLPIVERQLHVGA